jgi:hypothetical protein
MLYLLDHLEAIEEYLVVKSLADEWVQLLPLDKGLFVRGKA